MTVRVRRAHADDLPALLALFQELDRLQRDWRLFTPRPGVTDERSLEVSGVIVREGRRREGIGRLLMQEAVRFSRERGLRWVTLHTFGPNRGAMEFWEGLGFTPRVVELASPVDDLSRRLLDG